MIDFIGDADKITLSNYVLHLVSPTRAAQMGGWNWGFRSYARCLAEGPKVDTGMCHYAQSNA